MGGDRGWGRGGGAELLNLILSIALEQPIATCQPFCVCFFPPLIYMIGRNASTDDAARSKLNYMNNIHLLKGPIASVTKPISVPSV